jgi:oligosaccharide translocation protein RFT1
MSSSKTAAAARGTLWSVGLRLLSFLCTQITLRWVDPIALGKANIDLELAFGFILFFSREGFRLVLAKEWNSGLAYATRILHTIVALLAWMWLCGVNKSVDDEEGSFDYRLAATLYCIAAWMEGWAEPRILKALFNLQLEHKVYAEGMATVTKTFITVLAIWQLGDTYPVTAFGVAQIGYALVYNVVLYQRVPTLEDDTKRDDKLSSSASLRNQVLLFTLQGLFKHALTEGDRILLVLMLSEGYDKGLYALASAYGGMAARLLFQPLEENARLLWSKLVVAEKQNDKKEQLLQSYTGLVKLVVYIGLVFAALGTNYTDILLQVLGGASRRPAAPVLSAFCIYTLTMALNGMTEAFWYASAVSREQVGQLSLVHFIIGILAYAGLAPLLVSHYGTVGLVAANIVAMLLRSLYALRFASRYFQQSLPSLVSTILPHPMVLCGFALTFCATKWSQQNFLEREVSSEMRLWLPLAAQHVGVGVACLVGVASLVVMLERPYFRSLRNLIREKKE